MTGRGLLWLGVEPTPYLLALQAHAGGELPFEIDCAFERRDASQAWGLPAAGYVTLDTLGARARVLSSVLRRRYRAVLLEGWGTPWLAVAGVASLAAGVPLVVSGDTWQAAGGSRLSPARALVRRLLLRRAAATLPGGSRQRAFFLAERARPERLVVRQMTVDVGAISRRVSEVASRRVEIRAALGLPSDGVVAVSVARLVPEKGIDLLLRALADVPELILLVVGNGPQRRDLQDLAAGLGVRDRVVWAGRLPHEDVVNAYAAADLFVLPSRFEPWGLAVNEALACGLPVIVSSAAGSVDDLVAGRETGAVVPVGDVAALARALARMTADPPLRQRMSMRAREVMRFWTFAQEVAAIGRALALAVPA